MRLDLAAQLLATISDLLDQFGHYLAWLDSLDCVAFGAFRPGDRLVARVRRPSPTPRTLYVLAWWDQGRPRVRFWDVADPWDRTIPERDLRHYRDHLAPGDVAREFDRHEERWSP